jgi:site-specific recombinase XerD
MSNSSNDHTRRAYARACSRFFAWCEQRGLTLTAIRPFDVGAWVKELQENHGAPGVKQQLAAVRMLFDWLVIGQIVPMNPAAAVRGPKHVVKTGKPPCSMARSGASSSTAFRTRPCAICAIGR